MSNHPQIPVEKIDLLPHPLDVWRASLNALIAVAPGTAADIAWHLNDAREKTLACRDFSAASQGEASLIDRLMLLSAGKLFGHRLDTQQTSLNAFGFTHRAPSIGIDLSAAGSRGLQPIDQPDAALPCSHEAQKTPLASSCPASTALALQGQPTPASPSPQPDTATLEPEHEPAPRSAAGESLDRPLGDSSCQ